MDETAIAAQVRQNVPVTKAPEPSVPTPDVPEPQYDNILPTELDDLTLYKASDYFGVNFKPSDTVTKQRIQSIYDYVSSQLGTRDYLDVMSRVSDLEQMIGSKHTENRIYRLYQWVGLDRIRQNAEKAMRLMHE
jgi:hypothetical protein